MNNHRRRKKRHTHGNKTVDVCRGKNGYGFTISGQQPCILSCIVAGSPADRCGLKTGDYLLSVNNLNVSKASHDEVVRLIGSSSGTLTLVIAEKYNDSDSSDDDYQNRPKNKYPNRIRLRQHQGKPEKDAGFGRERSENTKGRNAGSIQISKKLNPSLRTRGLSPVVERYSRGFPVDVQQAEALWGHHPPPNPPGRGVENMDPLSVAVYPRRQKHHSAGPPTARQPQGTKHTIITREMRMVKSQSNPENLADNFQCGPSVAWRGKPQQMPPPPPPLTSAGMTAQDLSNILYPSIQPHDGRSGALENVDYGEVADPNQLNIRIIVGYVGSVEMPRDAHMECTRLQSIRSAVRRLRVDHKVHTLVLMDIYVGGIILTNTLGNIVALYTAQKIAFSGTYPDDKRFFGIVTLQSDEMEGDMLEEAIAGSSCHVFMVDPNMAIHAVHIQKAKSFAIPCTMDPGTKFCEEFPPSASLVVKQISKLYRHRNGSVNELDTEEHVENAHPAAHHGPRNSEGNSSNSDSGLGFKEDHAANGEPVFVVEMADNSHHMHPHNASSSQDSSLNWTAERSAFQPADGSMYKSTGESDLSALMPPGFRMPMSGTSDPGSNTSSNLNTSASSNDVSLHSYNRGNSVFDRLNLRVMPDPSGLSQAPAKRPPVDILDKQNSADNLRRSMHRYMQSAAQQKVMDLSGSDAESLRSGDSNNSGNVVRRSKSNTRSQGVSTSSDPADPNKLSPRVFQQPGHQGATRSLTQPEFLVPALPVLTKPPVPERRPVLPPKSYTNNQVPITPVRNRPLPERPKSTPPIRGAHTSSLPDTDTDGEYDSDPGSVMAMGVDDEEWNGKIDESHEQNSPQSKKTKRRFSEGFFMKKSREKDVENSRLSKGGSFKQIKIKRRPTLSNSHESLVVSDAAEFPQNKLNGAPSVTSILHHPGGPTENGGAQFGRSAGWAIGLDRLLADRAGLATFTEFLKKEYSQENVDFWVKCERYKAIEDADERKKEANDLWNLHVSPNSSESVNLDAATQAGVEKGVETAPPDLFMGAQTHIFWLMKQDSYPRFLKSDLYKQCYKAEIEGKPLPFSGTSPEDENKQKEEKKIPGMKKSKSTVSEKRRQSIFAMWKNRSDKRLHKVPTDPDMQQTWNRQDGTVRAGAGSLDLVDLNVISKEIKGPPREDEGKDENGNKDVKFFRVTMPDGSTTVVKAKPGTPIKDALCKLCERRTLTFASLEVTQVGQEKPLDVGKDMVTLASKEIKMEKRVLFQVDLSTRRTLIVRAKPSDTLRTALKSLLPKYNYKSEDIVAHLVGSGTSVDVDAAITNIEGQRIIVQTEEDFAETHRRRLRGLPSNHVTWSMGDFEQLRLGRKEWGGFGSHRGKPPLAPRSRSTASLDSGETEDDNSQLVRDIKSGKLDVAHLFDENSVYDPDRKHDDKRGEEARTSGLFSIGFLRRNSVGEKDSKPSKPKKSTTGQRNNHSATSSGRSGGSIKDPDAENLFERLNRALDRRIDDQRGISKEGYELPDFLKVESRNGRPSMDGDNESVSSRRERRNSDSSILDFESNHRLSLRSLSQESVNNTKISCNYGSPMSGKIPYMDQSFSQDGIVPTNAEAKLAFASARNYPGSPKLDQSWQSNVSMEPAPRTRDSVNSRLSVKTNVQNPQVPPRRINRSRTPDSRFRPHLTNETGMHDEKELGVRPLSPRRKFTIPTSHVLQVAEAGADHPDSAHGMEKKADEAPSPPARKPRKPVPLPPPRKTLSTPKKFPIPKPSSIKAAGSSHSHQNSTSSELSHQSDSTSTTYHSGGSPVSTPSPTTHDLVLEMESSPDSPMSVSTPGRTRPRPPPRPSKRTPVGSEGSSADEISNGAKKTLSFEKKDVFQQKKEDPDVQVSYV